MDIETTIARIFDVPAESVTSHTLLDSLSKCAVKRVELVMELEAVCGVDLEQSEVSGPDVSVNSIRVLVAARRANNQSGYHHAQPHGGITMGYSFFS